MNIAIIPARGGSTRIPKKNIKEFAGKPIIAYSIEAALKSNSFYRVIVSTDSDEIADVAKKFGAEVPFMRPKELGENKVNLSDVVYHAVNLLQDNGDDIEYACCILATAPFLSSKYLAEGFEKIKNNDVDSVVSVTTFAFPIKRAFEMTDKGRVRFIWPEHEFSHSNDLPQAYHDAGQFFWLNTKKFMKTKSILGKEVIPIVLPEYLVRDIDTEDDWETAEIMYEACIKKGLL